MPVKAKFKNSIENLKSELKERQERLIKDWETAKRDLKARQKLFTREIKTKQDEFFLEWDEVQERSKEKLDQIVREGARQHGYLSNGKKISRIIYHER